MVGGGGLCRRANGAGGGVKQQRVIWCNRGWLPYSYGFCPNESAWHREVKRLRISSDVSYPTSDGCCTHLERNGEEHGAATIVTIGHIKRPTSVVIGLIVHEAMHVWRQMRETIGEREPSAEFEAYSIQNIAGNLIAAYEATRGKLCK